MIALSKMASSVQPSATLAAAAKAKELKAQGVTVYDFSLGEPDFNTPAHICEAAYRAMPRVIPTIPRPTAPPGCARPSPACTRRPTAWTCTPEQVIVSNGAKHSLHNALAAMVGPGDEVIIPTPYWVSYSDLVQMTGASYILVPTTLESVSR